MARKSVTDMSAWPSLTLEGNLLAPAMVAQIDLRQAAEQAEEDYGIRKGLTIREEISTAFRVGQYHYNTFAKLEHPSADATRRFIKAFLEETFGFDDISSESDLVAYVGGGRVPVVVVPPDEALDRRSPTLSVDRSRSPAFTLQDYLNDKEEALWGLSTNGVQIRLMRDNASLTRPAFIEADLAQIFTNEDAASFAALWLIVHRSRFGVEETPATDCALERWREAGAREGEVARDRLAKQVETALKVLGSGFLEANPELARQLQSAALPLTGWFNELLRLVYRLIFLMVAEDRNLLHPDGTSAKARALYAQGYSLTILRAQSARASTWDKHHDCFEGLKIVFRALTRGEDKLALPALGGLFAPDNLPYLGRAILRNKAFMEAIYRLSWLSEKSGMVPINWRAMETEELGSVYEFLLELQPQLADDGKTLIFASEAAEQKGNQRKTTGSYYTPDSLVQALLDTALDPVLDMTETETDNPEEALLKLSVIDPACGSGHFLLAAARRIATRVARIRAEGTPSLGDFRHALRDVARCCIHGVDKNPMAVELTKVALWIETVDPGLPLGFFDAQVRCGDALLGVFDLTVLEDGIPVAAYKPLTGDDKPVAAYYKKKNKAEIKERDKIDQGFGFNRQQNYIHEFAAVRALPENTLKEVEAKSQRLKALSAEGAASWTLSRACDLYVSAFLLPKREGGPHAGMDGMPQRGRETVPTSGALWEYLRGVTPFGPMFAASVDAASDACAFHWPLEFPDVMAGGGFDVVLGNPPWERIKVQEKEFFAARDAEIATATNKAERDKLIKALNAAEPGSAKRALFDAFETEKRLSESTSAFVRTPGIEGGRFPLTGTGDVNTYALFAELFAILGVNRAGVIVPTGVATDSTTAPFFAQLVEQGRLVKLADFENREKLFPAVDSRLKFCLLTLGRNQSNALFSFFLTNPAQLSVSERNFILSSKQIASINPETKTAPIFRSRRDAEVTAKIYANSKPFGDNEIDGAWRPRFFKKMFDFGIHQDILEFSIERPSEEHLPVYEAKMITHFNFRASTYEDVPPEKVIAGKARYPRLDEIKNPEWDPVFRCWTKKTHFQARMADKDWNYDWYLSMRDKTNATNERTAIISIRPLLPSNDTLPTILPSADPLRIAALQANLSSLVLDFVARQKVGGLNLAAFIIAQFPVLPMVHYTKERLSFISKRVLELNYTSHSLAQFALDLGYDGMPFPWDEDRRSLLRADLDAYYARAYGLDRDELRYVLDPADIMGHDYPSETFRVLKDKEIRQYGEYRTQRLVLAAWDRMEADGTFAELGMAVAGNVKPAMQEVQLFDSSTLPDGAMARATQSPGDAGAVLAAILKALDGPTPARRVRMSAVMMLEPRLMTPLLGQSSAQEWQRLIGQEAEPLQGNVTGFVQRTNPAWGAALSNHRGNGRLVEDLVAGTWAPGAGLEAFDTSGWPDERAAFVLDALGALDLDQTIAQLPDEIERWVRDAAVA